MKSAKLYFFPSKGDCMGKREGACGSFLASAAVACLHVVDVAGGKLPGIIIQ